MIDENVAYASPATVYNIMKKNALISKWNKSGEEHEKGFKQPKKAKSFILMPSRESFTTTESSMSQMSSKIFLPCLELLIQRQGLFIRNQTAKLKDSTGLLKPSMFAGHRMFRLHTQKSKWQNGFAGIIQNALTEQFSILHQMKFSKVRWGKGL